ncbi:lactose transport system (lactose-binding protein) [Paenibacillus pasadenensis]|uniref:Lactose transport system (Lactose-binding protein) n=1 Tax=Paenibacillus pasadenensis TaxID=217090 RepID=A0A2N5N4C7_9BACL|nr:MULTISPECIES: extracellular solute-binding protein [Paenibacillus]PLT45183.1 lactose transport system (lactose-binding protein) [Paenibacillus pasadenensis]QGG55575.1 extracellular solute-binding protein [Paenibacillus sp. B01]
MKKQMAFAALAGVMALTACSSGNNDGQEGQSSGGGKVTVWAWDPNFNIAAMKLAKEAYAAENPDVNVDIIEYAQADIIQKLNTGLNSGTTSGLPNVVLIEDYRAQSFLQAYPDSFYKMSDLIKPGDFADYKLSSTSLDGVQYGVPFDSGVTGLYVRKDLMEQAGYSVDDLQNIDWDQFIEIGKAVKEKTGKAMLTQDPNDLGLIRMMIQSAGAWYTAEDGTTPDLKDNAALKDAFATYKKLMESDTVKMISDWSQFLAGFNTGDVATVPTGNWITPSVKAEASQSGQWAVVPMPKLKNTASSVNASNLGGSSWYVLNVDGKEQAAEFLAKTLGSDAELYQKLVTDIGVIGTLKAATEGDAYNQEDAYFGGQKIVSDFAAWTQKIPQVNYGMHTYAIEDILVSAMQSYLGGADLDKVLSDAQSQAESQLG